jgi:ATP-dependent Clp protease ATP-binding subunit ClpA
VLKELGLTLSSARAEVEKIVGRGADKAIDLIDEAGSRVRLRHAYYYDF